jgi:hypothetical protein
MAKAAIAGASGVLGADGTAERVVAGGLRRGVYLPHCM